jgi:hypothetical protein
MLKTMWKALALMIIGLFLMAFGCKRCYTCVGPYRCIACIKPGQTDTLKMCIARDNTAYDDTLTKYGNAGFHCVTFIDSHYDFEFCGTEKEKNKTAIAGVTCSGK